MLDHVGAQVITDRVGVPARGPQQPLHPIRAALPELLGQLPPVAPLHGLKQPRQIAAGPRPHLRPRKARGDALVQRGQRRVPGRDLTDGILLMRGVGHPLTPPALGGEAYCLQVPL